MSDKYDKPENHFNNWTDVVGSPEEAQQYQLMRAAQEARYAERRNKHSN